MVKKAIRVIAIIMAVAMLLSTAAFADAESVRASKFISYTSAGVIAEGNGVISIEFLVAGTEPMTEIGACTIMLYENDSLIKTFKYTDVGYEDMMGYGVTVYGSSVAYKGVPGREYYAVVTFYAMNDNGSAKIPAVTYVTIA